MARREHSQQELSNKLQIRGYDTSAIAWLLSELKALDMQSDCRYAEAYVHMRTQKGFGPLRIQAELQQRGVAAEIIYTVIAQDDEFWLAQVQKIRQKKFGTTIPSDFRAQARQMRFLQTRGFSGEQIKQVLRLACLESTIE
ncbi:MAG: regulatory protein RecX [Gammaproteobacteria bacterium]